ncbi:MAG TPA: D-alanine--D-alanine ligase [Actinomycetota bacterium]|nr:D-alanine--D-alanine ligase [Actinomycetota bacterium]
MTSRIAVLGGGRSPEREVSLRSGHRVASALQSRGHDAFLLDPAEGPFVETLFAARASACYVALHGKEGEDGTVQRLLDVLGVRYTGSGPHACQRAFDKILAKEALDLAGIPTPPWAAIQATALRDLAAGPALHSMAERIGLPLVVKPSRAGSAMGLTFVDHERDLAGAVMNALSFSDAAVIERRIDGMEVAAGMIGSADPLPLVEIVPKSGVFDYAARYTAGATEYFAPARLGPEATADARAAAARAFEVLGVADVARADVMVDGDGAPWVVDVNVSPGMTDTSLLPMAAQAAGIEFEELCDRVVRLCLQR